MDCAKIMMVMSALCAALCAGAHEHQEHSEKMKLVPTKIKCTPPKKTLHPRRSSALHPRRQVHSTQEDKCTPPEKIKCTPPKKTPPKKIKHSSNPFDQTAFTCQACPCLCAHSIIDLSLKHPWSQRSIPCIIGIHHHMRSLLSLSQLPLTICSGVGGSVEVRSCSCTSNTGMVRKRKPSRVRGGNSLPVPTSHL